MKVKRVKMFLTGIQYMTEEEYKRIQEKRDWIDEKEIKNREMALTQKIRHEKQEEDINVYL